MRKATPGLFRSAADRIWVGAWRFDPRSGELRLGSHIRRLDPKAAEVLLLLVEAGGALVTREALFERLWGGRFRTDAALNQLIRVLRRAFADDHATPVIETLRGRGYRLIAPVRHAPRRPTLSAALGLVLLGSLILSVPGGSQLEQRPGPERIDHHMGLLPVQFLPGTVPDPASSSLVRALGTHLERIRGVAIADDAAGVVDRWVAVRFSPADRGAAVEVRLVDARSGGAVWQARYPNVERLTPDLVESVAIHVASAVEAELSLMCIESLTGAKVSADRPI